MSNGPLLPSVPLNNARKASRGNRNGGGKKNKKPICSLLDVRAGLHGTVHHTRPGVTETQYSRCLGEMKYTRRAHRYALSPDFFFRPRLISLGRIYYDHLMMINPVIKGPTCLAGLRYVITRAPVRP